MTPVERLQAAIDKLEVDRECASEGAWKLSLDDDVVAGNGSTVARLPHINDAILIVTLHRTIDAQLAILRAGIENESVRRSSRLWNGLLEQTSLALADAILGDQS